MNPRLPRYLLASLLITALTAGIVVDNLSLGGATPANAADTPPPLVKMKSYPTAQFTAAAALLPAGLATAIKRDLGSSGAEYLARSAAAIDAGLAL